MICNHPRLGYQCFRVELSKDTYRRWKEVKQQLNLGNDIALAVHFSPCLSQPLLTLSPLDQGKGTFESGMVLPRTHCPYWSTLFFALKKLLHNIIMIMQHSITPFMHSGNLGDEGYFLVLKYILCRPLRFMLLL